jgi:DNA adenine methylase
MELYLAAARSGRSFQIAIHSLLYIEILLKSSDSIFWSCFFYAVCYTYPMKNNRLNGLKKKRLSPVIKWAGGKEQELKYILPRIPESFKNFYEPFVGGGAVFFAIQAEKKYINDLSDELIAFYRHIKKQDSQFFQYLASINASWNAAGAFADKNMRMVQAVYCSSQADDVIRKIAEKVHGRLLIKGFQWASGDAARLILGIQKNLRNKKSRMHKLEKTLGTLSEKDILMNLECAIKSAFYNDLRYLYNHRDRRQLPPCLASALYFFIRENAYSSMFRYNRCGHFNVPYGGIAYNRKNTGKKIRHIRSSAIKEHFGGTAVYNEDFEAFLTKTRPEKGDFIFLDPPYDSSFSTYAQNSFGEAEQQRLADYLNYKCKAKFMLVVQNTNLIQKLYKNKGLFLNSYAKTYLVSFKGRNDRNAEHLMITNYPVAATST